MNASLFARLFVFLFFLNLSSTLLPAASASVSVDLGTATIPSADDSSPGVIENTEATLGDARLKAIKFTASHAAERWDSIAVPVDVDGSEYNTLQFKVRFISGAEGKIKNFSIWAVDQKGGWNASRFRRNAKDLGNGWYQFSWDMVNAPESGGSADFTMGPRQVWIRYPFPSVAEGQPDIMEFADMQFVSGQKGDAGDPSLYAQWRSFVDNYEPDYSDSTKYLLSPEKGRFSTPIPFIKDGKALGSIVVPSDASIPLTFAGNELQHWMQEITGADVGIVSSPSGKAGGNIFLGTQFARGKYDADLDFLRDSDGFAVRAEKNNIYIFGATDKGTINGVFAFLENNTDIIWPRPQPELSAVFTPRKSLDIVWADGRERPATKLRGWGTNLGVQPNDAIWQTRNRCNFVSPEGVFRVEDLQQLERQGDLVQYGGGHNVHTFLDKNPDFYPQIDGKQVTEFDVWKHQPNFTAPNIAETVAENVLKYLSSHVPNGVDCVSINIEDNWGVSTDPKSLEPIKLPDGTVVSPDDPAFRSTQFFMFLNEVAKRINAVHPDMDIGTYAYFFSAIPPKVDIDPHIRVFFAPYPRSDYRAPLFSPFNDNWWKQLQGWLKKTPNLVMREYYGIVQGFRPLAEMVDAEVKSYVANGLTRYTAELSPDLLTFWGGHGWRGSRDVWNFLAMEYWLINRIYWNPDQDIEQLRKYYIRRTFQEAAAPMERFFGTIRAEWFKGKGAAGYVDPVPMFKEFVVNGGLEEQLRDYLKEASTLVKSPTSRMMIDQLRDVFEKWAAEAGDQESDKKQDAGYDSKNLSPEDCLYYLWGADTDWMTNPTWGGATVMEKDGKTVPAVRLTVVPERADGNDFVFRKQFSPGQLKLQEGDTLEFVLSVAPGEKISGPLSMGLVATDENNARLEAPAKAYALQPDGSLRVQWRFSPDGAAFDVTRIKELIFTIPWGITTGKAQPLYGPIQPHFDFYITDLKIKSDKP